MKKSLASNVVELDNPCEPFKLVQFEPEYFELLVFLRDGTIRLQTNESSYYYCTALFSAALDLTRLLKGKPTAHLTYGIEKNRVTDPDSRPDLLCVDKDKLMEGIEADRVTSNWPKVVEFFQILQPLFKEVESK